VAVVGTSGKTTLLETLALLRTPSPGMLTLDGIDVRSLDRPATRQQIAFVGRAEVFTGTIADNVRLGRTSVSAADIRSAIAMVGLTNSFARLPDGLQTTLAPDGRPLSTNEIGRLAIARAIVSRPRLLLIDGLVDGLDLTACPEMLDSLFDASAPWTLMIATARADIRDRCGRVIAWE
jgi:ABC-type transport system involved in cytochrome bd biosynthesis fused ATPase/permease subunit